MVVYLLGKYGVVGMISEDQVKGESWECGILLVERAIELKTNIYRGRLECMCSYLLALPLNEIFHDHCSKRQLNLTLCPHFSDLTRIFEPKDTYGQEITVLEHPKINVISFSIKSKTSYSCLLVICRLLDYT